MRGLVNGHAIYFGQFSDLIEKLFSLFKFSTFLMSPATELRRYFGSGEGKKGIRMQAFRD